MHEDGLHSMPTEHERGLRQITNITHPDDELPEKLVKKYWELKRCLDKISANVLPNDLARLCAECGFGKQVKAAELATV